MALDNRHKSITKAAWQKYQYNLFRYLMVIGRHAEIGLMDALKEKGYSNLSIPFANQMVLIARDDTGIRITELAALQGISKQLCYQSLRPIEQAGYIFREDDPRDGRAKLVKLTSTGRNMIADALIELDNISATFCGLIGIRKLKRLNKLIAKIAPSLFYYGLNIRQNFPQSNSSFAASAGQLSRHFETRLINLNIARGHRDLRPSFSQVLAYINLQGSEVSAIAGINGVSNQAVIRIASELEKLGYIERSSVNPTQRGKTLLYTQYGLDLIMDSVESVNTLESELRKQLGNEEFADFCSILKQLFFNISSDQGLDDYDAKRIKIGNSPEDTQTPQNPLILPELLLFIAAICEQETATQNGSNKLTRSLPPGSRDTSSRGTSSRNKGLPTTFSPGSVRTLSNTAIQSELVVAQIQQTIGKQKARALLVLLEQLAEGFGANS